MKMLHKAENLLVGRFSHASYGQANRLPSNRYSSHSKLSEKPSTVYYSTNHQSIWMNVKEVVVHENSVLYHPPCAK